jgi:S-DNA-T family DNA segregation ATPase FtsK/SpoIIIE
MEKHLLNLQADKIEMVLAAHKAPARVWGGRLTPRTVQFHLALAANTKLARLEALTEEVALALGVPSVRLTRVNCTLSLEVQRNDSRFVPLAELAARLKNDPTLHCALSVPGTAILGLDSEGVPLLLRLSSPDVAHVLIAGTTGSGKTEMARTVITSLTMWQKPRDLRLALFVTKLQGFTQFQGDSHLVFPVVTNPKHAHDKMQELVGEMDRRSQVATCYPRIVVIVDELIDLLEAGGEKLEMSLTQLVRRGRDVGISVIVCVRNSSVRVAGGLMEESFPVRLVGHVAKADDARIAAGISGTGAEKLAGRGDFLLVAGTQIIRFQAAYAAP